MHRLCKAIVVPRRPVAGFDPRGAHRDRCGSLFLGQHAYFNMRAGTNERYSGLQARPLRSLLIVVIATVSLTASGQSPLPVNSTTTVSELLLPRNVVVPISVVNRFFRNITRGGYDRPELNCGWPVYGHKERDLRKYRQLEESDDLRGSVRELQVMRLRPIRKLSRRARLFRPLGQSPQRTSARTPLSEQ
jgi:hypothetical protein